MDKMDRRIDLWCDFGKEKDCVFIGEHSLCHAGMVTLQPVRKLFGGRETKDDEMMCKTYRRKTAQD